MANAMTEIINKNIRIMNYRTKENIKRLAIYGVMSSAVLKLNHLIFWWYYKRVPEFYHKWTILKSISLFKQNYEHAEFRYDGLNEVLKNASKREIEMRTKISNMELRLMGVTQDKIEGINEMFGTDLKGKSTLERDN